MENKSQRTLEEMKASRERYFQKKNGNAKESTISETYLKEIAESRKRNTDISLEGLLSGIIAQPKKRIVEPYPIEISTIKKFFNMIIERELSVNHRQLFVDENNEPITDQLVRYFSGNEVNLNPNKGIYLYGPVGRGKTLIMKSLMIMCAEIERKLDAIGDRYTNQKFKIVNSKSIVNEIAATSKPEAMKKYYSGVICIDDLGAEDSYKLYGNDMNVVGDIIIERYQRYQQSGLITHATSNITPDEWRIKYGERVESRMHEVFNVVRLLGEDKRKKIL